MLRTAISLAASIAAGLAGVTALLTLLHLSGVWSVEVTGTVIMAAVIGATIAPAVLLLAPRRQREPYDDSYFHGAA